MKKIHSSYKHLLAAECLETESSKEIMSTKDWNIVFWVFLVFTFAFGMIGIYPFSIDAEAARKDPIGNLWFGLAVICFAICTLAHYKTTYAGVSGGAIVYIIWILLVIGVGTASRGIIMKLLR